MRLSRILWLLALVVADELDEAPAAAQALEIEAFEAPTDEAVPATFEADEDAAEAAAAPEATEAEAEPADASPVAEAAEDVVVNDESQEDAPHAPDAADYADDADDYAGDDELDDAEAAELEAAMQELLAEAALDDGPSDADFLAEDAATSAAAERAAAGAEQRTESVFERSKAGSAASADKASAARGARPGLAGKVADLSARRGEAQAEAKTAAARGVGSVTGVEPTSMADLHALLEKGEKEARDSAAKAAAAKGGFMDEAEFARREQLWEDMPAGERRRCDREVERVLRAEQHGHYAVLGLRRSAPLSSIRQRYRQRALLTHPDKNPASDAPAAFEMLREAHETLADAAKRKAYDRSLRRKAEVRRARARREFNALVETAWEHIQYRSKDRPPIFYGAMAVALVLI